MTELLAGYLGGLKNAEHFGIVTQIDTPVQRLKTDNAVFNAAANALHAAITAEDIAYKKTQKDWNVERLKEEDKKMDDYMIGLRSILAGYAAMPDAENVKQQAKELLQLWKEFDFSTGDSYSGESSKVINMHQEVVKQKAKAEALGVWPFFEKALRQAQAVQELLSQRFDGLSGRVVGELKVARANTDAAVKQVFQVLNSMQVLVPSEEITELVKKLKAIEDYSKQYYLKSSSAGLEEELTTEPEPMEKPSTVLDDDGSTVSDVSPKKPE